MYQTITRQLKTPGQISATLTKKLTQLLKSRRATVLHPAKQQTSRSIFLQNLSH